MDSLEVSDIAAFLAEIDPEIPYALLGYSPSFLLIDLPFTSRDQAEQCYAAAREAGLTDVRIGDELLIW